MPLRRTGRTFGILLGYAFLFYLFDSAAAVFEVAPGVSPWYPSAGLNFALLLVLGLRFVPAVWVATLASGLLIAEPPITAHHLLLPSLIVTTGHAAAAAWLRRRFDASALFSVRAAGVFVGVVFLFPAAVSTLSVLSFGATGLYDLSWASFASTMLGWWIGDVVGMLTLTPILLVLAVTYASPSTLSSDETLRLHLDLDRRGVLSFALELGAVVGALYLAFYVPGPQHFQYYLCFLPLLWIALHHGLPRAGLAVAFLNFGAAVAVRHLGSADMILELQLFMTALALTGLLLGVLVSGRQRTAHALQEASRQLEARLHASSPDDETRRYAAVFSTMQDALSRSTDNLVELNEQLMRSERHLRNLNAEKDRFLSIISHDLKNPLVGIRGLAEMLLRESTPGAQKKRPLTLIRRSAQQALNLIENLLTWARLQTGHLSPTPERLNLHETVAASIDLLESHAAKKDIALENAVEPSLCVHTARLVADTVLRNLISNALKFTEQGGYVSISARPVSDGDLVEVAVADSGIGIPSEELDTIFHLAQGLSKEGTGGEAGTGLGLPLCRELIGAHDGDLRVESEEGIGTTFYFTLPAAERDVSRASPPPSTPLPRAPRSPAPPSWNTSDQEEYVRGSRSTS